jgi:hypothetical protein
VSVAAFAAAGYVKASMKITMSLLIMREIERAATLCKSTLNGPQLTLPD